MGIGDYLWPFQRKFSQIPCAREASIAALAAAPCIGAATLMIKGKPILSYKVTLYSGLAVLWITFTICRVDQARKNTITDRVKEAYAEGKID